MDDKDKLLIENDFTAFGFFNSGEISFKFVFLNKQIVEVGERYQYWKTSTPEETKTIIIPSLRAQCVQDVVSELGLPHHQEEMSWPGGSSNYCEAVKK